MITVRGYLEGFYRDAIKVPVSVIHFSLDQPLNIHNQEPSFARRAARGYHGKITYHGTQADCLTCSHNSSDIPNR